MSQTKSGLRNSTEQDVLLLIGAGRSGSTFVSELFARLPGLSFFGENRFLTPRLVAELWEDNFWLQWRTIVGENRSRGSLESRVVDVPADVLSLERVRVGGLIRNLIASLLGVNPQARVWGFKEVWNGGSSFALPWEPYDLVFPQARWVGLFRNPFHFALSCSQWDFQPFTFAYLQARLFDWLQILAHTRSRAVTGRYREIRFESLLAEPETVLSRVFDGLQVDISSVQPAKVGVTLKSSELPVTAGWTSGRLQRVQELILGNFPELSAILKGFEYSIPESVLVKLTITEPELNAEPHPFKPQIRPFCLEPAFDRHRCFNRISAENETCTRSAALATAERDQFVRNVLGEQREIFLSPPFKFRAGNCWLAQVPQVSALSDGITVPSSPLQLFEDGKEIGVPHSMHAEIEEVGAGRCSHWGEWFYFATSDNTNPNKNGRVYSLRVRELS